MITLDDLTNALRTVNELELVCDIKTIVNTTMFQVSVYSYDKIATRAVQCSDINGLCQAIETARGDYIHRDIQANPERAAFYNDLYKVTYY